MANLVGQTLGQYKIVEMIGQGGMATVYKSYQASLNRYVAIKVLPAQLSMDTDFVERFRREALAAAQLRHPNIITIYDVASQQDLYFIVMELLEGRTLDQILREGQPIPLPRVVSIISQVASALDYAHSQGIIHRDVKPSNISVDESHDDRVTLMDFGLVKSRQDAALTMTGMIMGTPRYMAPEQAAAADVDQRVDIYSLGIVLFELLTGQAPFKGETPWEILREHAEQAPPSVSHLNPSLPKALDAVVLKAMAKKPAERYPSAGELTAAFEAAVAGKASAVSAAAPKDIPVSGSSTTSMPAPVMPRPIPVRPGPLAILGEWLSSARSSISALVLRVRTSEPRVTGPSRPPVPLPPAISLPDVPPSIVEMDRPSLILRPHLHKLLDPIRETTLRELLSEQEPERLIDYITQYGQGRFLITGYGSFGGSTLVSEIVDAVTRELDAPSGSDRLLAVWFELVDSSEEGSIFKASVQVGDVDLDIGQVTTMAQDLTSDRHPVGVLLDTLADLMVGRLPKSSLAKTIKQAIGPRAVPSRLVIILDKATDLKCLRALVDHPLFDQENVSYLVIVEREGYDQWDGESKRFLQRRKRFQVWDVPCLWEPDHHLVERTMNLLFRGYRIDSPELEEIRRAFDKHIAFVGRGAIGKTVRELQQLRYWRFDEYTKQPFVALERLDRELVLHNAWIQDTLETNWELILGRNFPGWQRTDRAKQGVYALMDWVTDCATFTLEEVLEQAARTRVVISSYKRLRDEVVLRLLDVLVGNGYLQRVEDEFDIVWGRDATESAMKLIGRITHAEEIASRETLVGMLEERLKALLSDHEAASNQLISALGEVERARLKRQIEGLEQEIEQVQGSMDSLRKTHSVEPTEDAGDKTVR